MPPPRKLPRDCDAFTTFEVVLAAGVLLFAIVSALQLVVVGTRMLDFSRKQTIATQIIHAEIDQVHLTDWTTVKNWADNNSSCSIDLTTKLTSPQNTDANNSFGWPELQTFQNVASVDMAKTAFKVQRTTAYVSGRTDMVQITFVVSWKALFWTGSLTRTYSRQGTTYFGKNGLFNTYQH